MERSARFFWSFALQLSASFLSSFLVPAEPWKKLLFPPSGMGDGLTAGMPMSQLISTIVFRKMIYAQVLFWGKNRKNMT